MRAVKFIAAILMVLSLSGIALAQPLQQDVAGGTTVASGFNGPMGVLVDSEGNLWVIDTGMGGDQTIQFFSPEAGQMLDGKMGMTARVVKVTPEGDQTDVAVLPSLAASATEVTGAARLALLDGTLYASSGGWAGEADSTAPDLVSTVVRVDADGTVTPVANTWDFEKANNPDQLALDTHPYGITASSDGWLWIADAGGNALLRANPATGEIQLVAAFEGLPGGFPNPARGGAVEADPVPTAVAFDDSGNAYVSLLSGAPFIPGNAKVLRVTPDGVVSDYATGLTTLTDLQRAPDGELYAVQFGLFTQDGPTPNTGAVLRIHEGGASEVVVNGLPFPTALAFDGEGNAYVTVNGVGAPESGAVVRFDHLTEMAGEPLPMPAQ